MRRSFLDRKSSLRKFALVGVGFWGNAQSHAWQTLPDVQCVAIVDRDLQKAQKMAERQGIENYYGDVNELLEHHPQLDFIDVVTPPQSHAQVIMKIASHRFCPRDIITQKPIAPTYQMAEEVVRFIEDRGKRLWVHENWRWQSQIQQVHRVFEEHQKLGRCTRAEINCVWARQGTYAKQPMLKTLSRLIIAELGPHLFDTARFFFGEAISISCKTRKIGKEILGEDNATIHMQMDKCPEVTIRLSYTGDPINNDYFPQTLMRLIFEFGSIELKKDYKIFIDVGGKKIVIHHQLPIYDWVDKDYLPAQVVMPRFLQEVLKTINLGETNSSNSFSARYQLENVLLIEAAYASAEENTPIILDDFRKGLQPTLTCKL